MACGKTTLGRALSHATGIPFVDTDAEVERIAGMTVAQIFDRLGEPAFRALEADVIRRLCAMPGPRVVACGGGTPCRESNMQLMLHNGTVVWLDADTDITVTRLLDAPGLRPLARGHDAASMRAIVESGKAARHIHYSRAHARFDSSRLDTPAQIDSSVRLFISKFIDI